ncbi:MAG: protein-glutamate O-methyltransferase CheR [Pseudomonadota bacterium]
MAHQASQEAEQGALVPGISPSVYSPSDFARISTLVQREAGIVLNDRKQMLAYTRLAPLVRRSGLGTFAQYLDRIEREPKLAAKVIAALTTNHTYFNREPHHFEHFTKKVRANLISRAERGETVRLWSAGCSSGEEVWTLLMVLLGEDRSTGQRLAQRKIIALASDLADHAVEAARLAIYPADALEPMPEQLRRNWCEKAGNGDEGKDQLSITQELRRMVRFRQLNLLRPWPFSNLFDVIFCRNVMIYFDQPAKEQLVLALARQLRPGGTLYIGHSERVSGEATALLDPVGPTIYQRRAT